MHYFFRWSELACPLEGFTIWMEIISFLVFVLDWDDTSCVMYKLLCEELLLLLDQPCDVLNAIYEALFI